MAYELLGKDFIPADVEPKVTGRAKYAEDFRVDGMVFCRLLMSPVPRGRVTRIDAGRAEAMPGVVGILTADEVPSHPMNPILSNEPLYVGQPILAVAAVDETTAMDAIEAIDVEIEPLEYVIDPLDSLYPGGPNARSDGNSATRGVPVRTIKWTAANFADEPDDSLPIGEEVLEEWSYGDLDAGFQDADLVLDESFVTAGNSHHSMEPRTNMAYWEDGRCHLFASSQSQSFILPELARLMDVPEENIRLVAEYCGGGFGSKGHAYPLMAIPALLSRKIGRPVMMRVSRADEYFLGIARGGFQGRQVPVTSAYMVEALDQGAAAFNWQEKRTRSSQRDGSKVRGVAIGQGFHNGSFAGFDGLVRLTPEGRLHIHTGVGNLGTYSHTATSRVAAEVLKCSWENCVVERGDTNRHLPFNSGQFGSNTSGTQTRTTYAAAMDAVEKLKAIAAMDLGGDAEDYDLGDEKVFRRSDPTVALTYPAAARRAIELGGRYDGHEVPENLNSVTKRAVAGLAGAGLVGVARDQLELPGVVPALAVGFIEIELDEETGKYEILDYVGVTDCGTVLHPQGLATQIKGGAVMGIGFAALERIIYDPQNGLPGNMGLYQAKPPSYLDVPATMQWGAVDQPDFNNPVGVKGIGEPVMGAAASALICAISDALGGHYFNRAPVVSDMIVNAASGREQSHRRLQVSTA